MQRNAFTLVELMISVSIIVILAGVSMVSYQGVQARGRDARRKNDLSNIKISLSSYYTAQIPLKFPSQCGLSGCATSGGTATPSSSPTTTNAPLILNGTTDSLTTALVPSYLREMPVDPRQSVTVENPPGVIPSGAATTYVYTYRSATTINSINDQDFYLKATLESRTDASGWAGGASWTLSGFTSRNE